MKSHSTHPLGHVAILQYSDLAALFTAGATGSVPRGRATMHCPMLDTWPLSASIGIWHSCAKASPPAIPLLHPFKLPSHLVPSHSHRLGHRLLWASCWVFRLRRSIFVRFFNKPWCVRRFSVWGLSLWVCWVVWIQPKLWQPGEEPACWGFFSRALLHRWCFAL